VAKPHAWVSRRTKEAGVLRLGGFVELFGEILVVLCTVRIGGIVEDRLAEAGGFCEADIAANFGVKRLRRCPRSIRLAGL
jgi:hypothetical protein